MNINKFIAQNRKEFAKEFGNYTISRKGAFAGGAIELFIERSLRQLQKETDKSWRTVLKDKTWIKVFLKKHHPELVNDKIDRQHIFSEAQDLCIEIFNMYIDGVNLGATNRGHTSTDDKVMDNRIVKTVIDWVKKL